MMIKPKFARAAVLLLMSQLTLAACSDPGENYDSFLARADRSPRVVETPDIVGVVTDVTGDFLYNIALKPLGDVYLELRVSFTSFTLNEDGGATVVGDFRFPDDAPDALPLASFTTVMDQFGRMVLDVGQVRIDAARSPVKDTAVETDFALSVIVISEREHCGLIDDDESVVLAPIALDLKGTTFGGQRYGENGELPQDVPSECPFETVVEPDPGADMGVADMGVGDADDDSDMEDNGLQPPDVDLGTGIRADVTGRFWMSVVLANTSIQLTFIVDLNYHETETSASVDGTLRSPTADLGAPAIGQFTEPVDENGEFSVIIPGLLADSTLGPVSADVALAAIIRDADTMCGEVDGTVRSPIQIALAGTTFGMVRIADDAITVPDNALGWCP